MAFSLFLIFRPTPADRAAEEARGYLTDCASAPCRTAADAFVTAYQGATAAEPPAHSPESAAPTTAPPLGRQPIPAAIEAEAQSYLTDCDFVAHGRLDECLTYQRQFIENYAWSIQEGDAFAQQGVSHQLLDGNAYGILILRPNRLQACAWALARVVKALDQANERDMRDVERICGALDAPSLDVAKVRAAHLAAQFAPTQR